jgi:RNA-directed DNA polymerase
VRRWYSRGRPHLQIHPGKTRLVTLANGEGGFEFLGFHHRMVLSRRWGKRYYQRWPSRRAMAAVRAKVKPITAPRARLQWHISALVSELNPVLRGWGNYFARGNSAKRFSQIDSYVHQRLVLFDMKKRKKRGRWRMKAKYTNTWYPALGVYRLTGTVRSYGVATART